MINMKHSKLYLTSDKLRLIDKDGNVIAFQQEQNGSVFYGSVSIESEAYERRCKKTHSVTVCTAWEEDYSCKLFEDVEICTQWDYVPNGFSNIS